MSILHLLLTPARRTLITLDSPAIARRNAMVANTELAARRAEREEVESFLAALAEPVRVPRPQRISG